MSVGERTLVERACGVRHGIVTAPVIVPTGAADPPGVVHASVGRDDEPTRSAGGGAARTVEAATTAAVGEALERMCATVAAVPSCRASRLGGDDRRVRLAECTLHSEAQQAHDAFPHRGAYPSDEWLAETFGLGDNEPTWVPAALVALGHEYGAVATSSGLAAAPTVTQALLRAVQELVERDAYVTTWLHQLGGLQVDSPELDAELRPLGGSARAFDLTPAFSPHPVALVAVDTTLGGRARPSIGIACRARWSDAVEKAFLEACQGTVFVGHRMAADPGLAGLTADRVTGFDEHAVFYAANPDRWLRLPLLADARPAPAPPDSPIARDGGDRAAELAELTSALGAAGVRLFYRDLTTVDANQLGVRVVRVVAPELTPLHHDHRWPFLGGRAGDVHWRYPDADVRRGGRAWPSPFPHALG